MMRTVVDSAAHHRSRVQVSGKEVGDAIAAAHAVLELKHIVPFVAARQMLDRYLSQLTDTLRGRGSVSNSSHSWTVSPVIALKAPGLRAGVS